MSKTDYITFEQAAKAAPGRPTASTIWRWARRGVHIKGGTKIRLRHIRAGARLYTTREWLDAFFHATAEADAEAFPAEPAPEPKPKPIRRRRRGRVRDIQAQLKEAGL